MRAAVDRGVEAVVARGVAGLAGVGRVRRVLPLGAAGLVDAVAFFLWGELYRSLNRAGSRRKGRRRAGRTCKPGS